MCRPILLVLPLVSLLLLFFPQQTFGANYPTHSLFSIVAEFEFRAKSFFESEKWREHEEREREARDLRCHLYC